MNFGVSPLTYAIYIGKSKPLPNGRGLQWVGKRTDVTEGAIQAVFEHMWLQAKETGAFEIVFPGLGTMTLIRNMDHETKMSGGSTCTS